MTQKVLASARLCVTTHLLARGGGEGYVTFGNVYYTDLENPSKTVFSRLERSGVSSKVCSLNSRLLRGRGGGSSKVTQKVLDEIEEEEEEEEEEQKNKHFSERLYAGNSWIAELEEAKAGNYVRNR